MPEMRVSAARAAMLRNRRHLRESVAGLAITVAGAVAVGLVVESWALRLGGVLVSLGVAAYTAWVWVSYARSRRRYEAERARSRVAGAGGDLPPHR